MTLVFAIANLLNACFYCYKLTRVPCKEIGTVKLLILQGLVILFLFNMPYKLFTTRPYHLFDTFINSLTETFMLFLNLVLSHGMYASNDVNPVLFYAPKLVTSLAVFIGLWAWSYADVREF